MIRSTTVTADKNPKFSTSPGNNTTDKVFLLSVTEAIKYFSTDETRRCVPTDYVIAQGAEISDSNKTGGKATCVWWLRSPGCLSNENAAIGYSNGSVSYIDAGIRVNYVDVSVRPAMWISTEN